MLKSTEDSIMDIPMLPSICFSEGFDTSICCMVSRDRISGLLRPLNLPPLMIKSLLALRISGILVAEFIIRVRMLSS